MLKPPLKLWRKSINDLSSVGERVTDSAIDHFRDAFIRFPIRSSSTSLLFQLAASDELNEKLLARSQRVATEFLSEKKVWANRLDAIAGQIQGRLDGDFALAGLALALRRTSFDQVHVAELLCAALAAYVRSMRPDLTFDINLTIPSESVPPAGSEETVIARLRSVLATGFGGILSARRSEEFENVALRAAAMVAHGLRRVLGVEAEEATQTARIDVLLADLIGGAQVATLVIERDEELSGYLANRDGCSILYHDVYLQGFLALDREWEKALMDALACAQQPKRPKPLSEAFRWRLEFREKPPISVGGASAGAAKALLLMSLRTGIPLDPMVLVSACLECQGNKWHLAPVGSEQEKLFGLVKTWIESFEYSPEHVKPTLVLADRENSDQGLDAVKEAAKRFGVPLQSADTVPELFLMATGERRVVDAYFEGERRRTTERLRAFLPSRLEASIAAGQWIDLEELNASVEILERPRGEDGAEISFRIDDGDEMASADPRRPRDSEAKRPSPQPADEAFDRWLASGVERRMTIFGPVGSGKTWLGLRWALRLAERFYKRREGASAGPPTWPIWIAARDLAKKKEVNEDSLKAILQKRLKESPGYTRRRDGSRKVRTKAWNRFVDKTLAGRRIVLIVDGWDEATEKQHQRLTTFFGQWLANKDRRLVVLSRREGVNAATLTSQGVAWDLRPLASSGHSQPAELIRRWFGADEEQQQRAAELWRKLQEHPDLVDLVRSPLMAAIVCWLWDHGLLRSMPTTTTELLEKALRQLLLLASRPSHSAGAPILTNAADECEVGSLVGILSELAYRTFQPGERWGFEDKWAMIQALRDIKQGSSSPEDVIKAFTGRYGLFTHGLAGRLEVVHQSFAELLVALWAKRELDKLAVPTGVHDWLEDHGGIRLLDPRWLEVWRHLASLLDPQRFDVLLGVLDEIQNRKQNPGRKGIYRQPPADILDSAIQHACQCIAARGRADATDRAERMVQQILDKWRQPFSQVWLEQAALALATQGWIASFVDIVQKKDIGWRAALKILGNSGPLARPYLRLIFEAADDPTAFPEATFALEKLRHFMVDLLPDVRDLLASGTPIALAKADWALDIMREHGESLVPQLRWFLEEGDFGVKLQAVRSLGSIGVPDPRTITQLASYLDNTELHEEIEMALARLFANETANLSLLTNFLRHNDKNIRASALRIVLEMRSRASCLRKEIFSMLSEEGDKHVLKSALAAIKVVGVEVGTALDPLILLLDHSDPSVRLGAGEALGAAGKAGGKALPALEKTVTSRRLEERRVAAKAIGMIGVADKGVLQALCGSFDSTNDEIFKSDLLEAIVAIDQDREFSLQLLREHLGGRAPYWLRKTALYCIGAYRIDEPKLIERAKKLLKDESSGIVRYACYAIGKAGNPSPEIYQSLIANLSHESKKVSRTAAFAIDSLLTKSKNGFEEAIEAYQSKVYGVTWEILAEFGWIRACGVNALRVFIVRTRNAEMAQWHIHQFGGYMMDWAAKNAMYIPLGGKHRMIPFPQRCVHESWAEK